VTEEAELAAGFETQRPYLHAIAFRVLGSHADADDAVRRRGCGWPGPVAVASRTCGAGSPR
jgi:hypothetical protein